MEGPGARTPSFLQRADQGSIPYIGAADLHRIQLPGQGGPGGQEWLFWAILASPGPPGPQNACYQGFGGGKHPIPFLGGEIRSLLNYLVVKVV